MAVTFLIGGTGNQLFEFASAKEGDKMSCILLSPTVRRMLGWTKHEQILHFDKPNTLQHILAFLVLLFDIVLAKLFSISLFTEFDTRSIKISARYKTIVRLGYFQKAPEQRSLVSLAQQLAPILEMGVIAVHVRGGDLLALERAGDNVYGIPGNDYYQAGIKAARDCLCGEGRSVERLLVLTDDPKYAATLDFGAEGLPRPEIQHLPLGETLARAVGADFYVSSNSTISYWIIRLRDGQRSLAPQPFQKRYDFELPDATQRLKVDY